MSTTVGVIENILKSPYSEDGFVALMREIFDKIEFCSGLFNDRVPSNIFSYIAGNTELGIYTTPKNEHIGVFSVQLKNGTYVENARSVQRSYARDLIEKNNLDAAVIAFYTPYITKWRLSFVRLEQEMKFENGKFKLHTDLTPARRYSYLVGKDEPCHTAISRFHDFIINKNFNPTLDDVEEAFSVEKVTKEFFSLYCEKFYELQEYLENNEDFKAESERCGFTSEQFAKKLLGQIVFLYFLQKKGWLGVKVWLPTLTDKEYRDLFYTPGGQGRIIKEYLPQIYAQQPDGTYKRNQNVLDNIPNDAEEVIANHMPRKYNWGDGSHAFLRSIFDYAKKHKGNFYDNYLEPLFYDTLNRNRGKLAYCTTFHARIPFLSGGLFAPIDNYDWKNSNFDIPDALFSNKKDNDDREGTGILDVFDRYNFTMSEDEPMEREVAIDPEMLGKVFENLLEIKDRRSHGAFYTPREIVHYMCQESLINYLVRKLSVSEEAVRDFILYGDIMKNEDVAILSDKFREKDSLLISKEIFMTDDAGKIIVNRLQDMDNALATVRVADPAVGSGAFPLGMVNEIVRARQNITDYLTVGMNKNSKRLLLTNERSSYALKRHTIKNSIFAVDIEPSAVDIAQLRLWLSLVIDDEINPEATSELDGHMNPLPLPNLECNIICGNSLIDEFEGIKLVRESNVIGTADKDYQMDFTHQAFENVLQKLLVEQDQLFGCDDPMKKEELKANIQAYKDALIRTQLDGVSENVFADYEKVKSMASKPFVLWQLDFARVFRDNGGFDIVIGNPPYIQLQKAITEDGSLKLGDLYVNQGFETFEKTGDIYCLFYEKGYRLLVKDGCLSFITSNKWMKVAYGEALRAFFAKKTNPVTLIDFAGLKIFDTATVEVNIILYQKSDNKGKTLACIAEEGCLDNLSVFVRQNSRISRYTDSNAWIILGDIEEKIKEKVEKIGVPLKEWNIHINFGIKTGMNEAFIIHQEEKEQIIEADPHSAELIRPILRGRDIQRFGFNFANLWLICTFPSKKYSIDDFPGIRDYLLSFGIERLEQTGKTHILQGKSVKSRKKTSNKWFETQDSISYWDDLTKPKIIWGEISDKPKFAFDVNGTFTPEATTFLMVGEDLPYLYLFLNSKLSEYYFSRLGTTTGVGTIRWKKFKIEQLPVPPIKNEVQKEYFEELARRMTSSTDGNTRARTIEEINENIYKMFNLSEEEISFIEDFCK